MEFGVLEARNRLSELLDRALAGEEVTITRRGRPQVVLTPLRRSPTREQVDALMAEAAKLRASYTGPPSSWAENKKDRDFGRRF